LCCRVDERELVSATRGAYQRTGCQKKQKRAKKLHILLLALARVMQQQDRRTAKKLKAAPPSPSKGQPGPIPPSQAKGAPAVAPPASAPKTSPQPEGAASDLTAGLKSPGEQVTAAEGTAPIISTTLQGLYFVGREEEAYTIALRNIANKVKAIDRDVATEHLHLVTSGQMFGAGKSQMGVRAVARANLPDVKERLMAKFPSPAERQILHEYLNAITITVHLQETSADKDASPTIAHYLADALRLAIVDASAREGCAALCAINWEGVPARCEDILAKVCEHTRRAIFVHWDEARICLEKCMLV